MKKILLSVFSMATLMSFGTGTTVDKADLKWSIGNQWYMAVTGSQSISGFTSTGTGATWDLTSFEAAPTKDTIRITTGASGTVLNLNSDVIPETNYNQTGTDYSVKTINYNSVDYALDGGLKVGLSHSYGVTWTENTTIGGFIAASVSGEVIADGQVTLSFGTFNAVLVEETYDIGGNATTYYYWETKEYGRVAYLIGSAFSVMTDNNFNSPTSSGEVEVANFNVYPNPASDQFTVKGDFLENVKMYDAVGNLVLNTNVSSGAVNVNTASFNAGLYFVKATSANGISTKSVVVK